MRSILICVAAIAVAACSGGGKGAGGGSGGTGSGSGSGFSRESYKCTPDPGANADADLAACTARPEGCHYGPALICHGAQPPPDLQEAERQAYADGSVACACVCPADEVACRTMP